MDFATRNVIPSMRSQLYQRTPWRPAAGHGRALARSAGLPQGGAVEAPFDLSDEQGRANALEALRAPLTGYFRNRIRQQEDVHDLVQEVFLRLSSRGLEDIDNLRSYAFQVAESVVTDRQRRRVVRHSDAHVELDPERLADTEIAPDRIVAGRDALRAALSVLDQLPERTRTIFVLRRLEGMRYIEISKRLGISVSAIEKHMVRAIAHLASAGDIR
ncbi:RNA polymerase sigma factor [Sphingomonas sp. MMS12-HWE2-04]|uniref:RNA polymerase sigma factor n=1 Tax=Sphingomonas sp. MMS12-HWE2-04 TaxID=3234199 RepID=UPI00384C8558